MRKIPLGISLLLLALAGCDPGPSVLCDYCHVVREGAKRYTCDKCKSSHVACDVERAVLHYEETGRTIRGHISYSATGVLVCPPPEEVKVNPLIPEMKKNPEPEGPPPLYLVIGFWLMVAAVVWTWGMDFGYSRAKKKYGPKEG